MKWKLWLGILISSVFLFIAFHNVDLRLLYFSIKTTRPWFIVPIVLLSILFYLIRALRWFYLLEPIKKIALSSLFSSVVIGFASNFVLPARLGEFIRANHIGRMEGISKSAAFATIVVERLFDVLTILLALLFVVLFIDFPGEWKSMGKALKAAGFLLLAFSLLSIILLAVLREKTGLFLGIVEKCLFFLPLKLKHGILNLLKGFSDGLVLVKGPGQLLAVIFYSLTLWGLYVFQIYILGVSMNMSLPFVAPFLILVVMTFSVTIPSAPGYIGTFHAACQYGLMLYGFSKEKALSMAILLHAAGFIPTVILGALLVLFHHTSLRKLFNEKGSFVGEKDMDI